MHSNYVTRRNLKKTKIINNLIVFDIFFLQMPTKILRKWSNNHPSIDGAAVNALKGKYKNPTRLEGRDSN